MTYKKPEIVQLEPGLHAIQDSMNKGTQVLDNHEFLATTTAYEGDE
jgi:hypothetical protein